MKRVNISAKAIGGLALALALTGCDRLSRDSETPASADTPNSTTRPVENVVAGGDASELQQKADATLEDAKLYCLGILLYSQKHGNLCPTNLDQTLPYLRAASHVPGGANHFEILYQGSFNQLPNPMTNEIVLIRSDQWQETNGTWTRIYGFTDGHCDVHSEPGGNFAAWEAQHSLAP